MQRQIFLYLVLWASSFVSFAQSVDSVYQAAFQRIAAGLRVPHTVSFEEAVYWVENAYLDNALPHSLYEQSIDELSQQYSCLYPHTPLHYLATDSVAVRKNATLFRLLTDTFRINVGDNMQLLRLPYRYTAADYAGEQDLRNTFVLKLLATGQGNCRSLAYLYKILANRVGANAALSVLPHHVTLRHKNQTQGWYTTELSSRSFPTEGWVLASGYVSLESVRQKAWLDTLTATQELCLTLLDLAQGYQRKVGVAQAADFVLQCTAVARQYYPQSVGLRLLEAGVYRHQYLATQSPTAQRELVRLGQELQQLGYRQVSGATYLQWLQTAPQYGKEANQAKKPTSSPTLWGRKIATLSQGQYEEGNAQPVVLEFAGVWYDTKQQRLTKIDTTQSSVAQEVMGRFVSVDPLTMSYPFYTPYQFAGNTPIQAIDLDGAEPKYMINALGNLTEPMITLLNAAFKYDKVSLRNSNWRVASGTDFGSPQKLNTFLDNTWFWGTGKPNATVRGKSVLYRYDHISKDDEFWIGLIAHEESHRQEVDKYGNIAFYSAYVAGGIGSLLVNKGVPSERIAYQNGRDYPNSYAEYLMTYKGGIALKILANEGLSDEDKSHFLEIIGNKFRRDVILQNQYNELAIEIVQLEQNIKLAQQKPTDRFGTNFREIDRIQREINSKQEEMNTIQQEQQAITQKYGN